MNVLGVEFAGSDMIYVLLEQANGRPVIRTKNKIPLSDTRNADALNAFRSAVETVLTSSCPDVVAIKEKSEAGDCQYRAGAAALKMEGILLAHARCRIEFISGRRINGCQVTDDSLHKYAQPAYKAAACVLERA